MVSILETPRAHHSYTEFPCQVRPPITEFDFFAKFKKCWIMNILKIWNLIRNISCLNNTCQKDNALRVPPAGTRLTVHRPLQVENSSKSDACWTEWTPKWLVKNVPRRVIVYAPEAIWLQRWAGRRYSFWIENLHSSRFCGWIWLLSGLPWTTFNGEQVWISERSQKMCFQ